MFQPGWQYNVSRKKSWEKGNEAEYNQLLERLKGMRTKKKEGPKQLKMKKRSKGKKRRERGERMGLSTSSVPGKHFIFRSFFFCSCFFLVIQGYGPSEACCEAASIASALCALGL